MKKYLVLFFIFRFLALNAQLSVIPNYSWNKDDNHIHKMGVRFTYKRQFKEKMDIVGGLNLEYTREKKSKSKYYDNYQIDNLNEGTLTFVQAERFLPLETKLRSVYVSPELLFQYEIASELWKIYLFSGLIFRFKVFENNIYTQVDYYNSRLTESAINTYDFKDGQLQFYNWYLPLGINIKLGKLPILISAVYGVALNRKSQNPIPYFREKRHNNINLGIGFSL